jgi:hypothetical protein
MHRRLPLPFHLRILANSGCKRFIEGKPAHGHSFQWGSAHIKTLRTKISRDAVEWPPKKEKAGLIIEQLST